MQTLIKPIADNFYRITLPMPFRLRHVHVYIVIHDSGIALFDTGINMADTFTKLGESLHAIGRSVTDIDRIYITHYHADHCGIAGGIKKASGAIIHTSAIGKMTRQHHNNHDAVASHVTSFYLRHGLSADVINHLLKLIRNFRRATIPYDIDRCLSAGNLYTLGDRSFEILPTPGHTRDHICYYFRDEGILLSGDHVLPDITPNLSPDLFNPDFRPLKSFLHALDGVKGLPVARVWPAHGDAFADLDARIEEIKAHHQERSEAILHALGSGPQNAFQLSMTVFGTDLPEFDKILALNETYVHLVELKREGKIEEANGEKQVLYTTG